MSAMCFGRAAATGFAMLTLTACGGSSNGVQINDKPMIPEVVIDTVIQAAVADAAIPAITIEAGIRRFLQAEDTIADVTGDPYSQSDDGLPALAVSGVPTSGSTVYNGVGILNYYTRDEITETIDGTTFTTISDESYVAFLGDAKIKVDFAANDANTNITGTVSNLIAGRGEGRNDNDVQVVNGTINITDGFVGDGNASALSATYDYDLSAFDRDYASDGTLTGQIRDANGGKTAIDLTDFDVSVDADIPNLFSDFIIVGEE